MVTEAHGSHGKTRDGQRTYQAAVRRYQRRRMAFLDRIEGRPPPAFTEEDAAAGRLLMEAHETMVQVGLAVLPNLDRYLEDADWLRHRR